MIINNNIIQFEEGSLYFGMNYYQAKHIFDNSIYATKEPNEKGIGHIILKNVAFYGLRGMCTIYFQDGLIKQISVTPEWNLYNLNDEKGNRLPIDMAVKMIAQQNKECLKEVFGVPKEKTEYGNMVFEVGNITIVTSMARSGDNYSVIIR